MECKAVEVLLEGNCEQAVDVEFTLPDYCPDIGKLLKCRVVPMITSQDVSYDALTAEGSAKISVIYLDDRDKKIRCCERDYPFRATVPFDSAAENVRLLATARVDYVNCRAVSQRKLDIHGAFTVHMTAVCPRTNEIVSEAEGEGLRLKKEACDVSDLVSCVRVPFDLGEAIELGEGKPPVASVIRTDAVLCVEECKPIVNKLIVRGDAVFTMVYCTEQGGEPERMEYVIPFNQFFDVAGLDDTCTVDLRLCTDALDVSLRTDADGEYRRVDVELRAAAHISAYRPAHVEWISDAYSAAYEAECVKKQMRLEKLCSTLSETTVIRQTVDTGDVKIESVYDLWCMSPDCRAVWRDGRTAVTGSLTVCMLLRDARQGVVYSEKNLRFECAVSQEASGQMLRPDVTVGVKSCGYTVTGESRIELQTELCLHCALYEEFSLRPVCAVEIDRSRPKSDENRPAAVLYFAEQGEELWDIAREFNSSVESIRADNGIEGDAVDESRLLIVTA